MNPMYLEATKLSEVFSEVKPFDGKTANWMGGRFSKPVYCNVIGGQALSVIPTEKTLKVVKNAMDCVFDENVYFTIVPRANGTALITMQYNKIIGSRWLCVLPEKEFEGLGLPEFD